MQGMVACCCKDYKGRRQEMSQHLHEQTNDNKENHSLGHMNIKSRGLMITPQYRSGEVNILTQER
jgi:hypothetical protein